MELALNLIWLAIGVTAFLVVPKRSGRVWVATAIALAVLFPIVSASDDLNAIQTFNDGAAALIVTIVMAISFIAIGRLRPTAQTVYAIHLTTPSAPRSPPAR